MRVTALHDRIGALDSRPSSGGHLSVQVDRKEFFHRNHVTAVLGRIALDVAPGEFVSILGPSGCGKSTLLRIISGLDLDFTGSVTVEGRHIDGPGRDRGVVFQEARLLPWRTVYENVAFALPDDLGRAERERRIEHVLRLVNLWQARYMWPKQLSGGMEKRVALARALVNLPTILLLDEPFAALDAFARYSIQDEISRIHAEEGTTTILVTHDVDEAVYLSDRVVVLSPVPAEIREIVKIAIARPRSRTAPAFAELRSKILDIVLNHG